MTVTEAQRHLGRLARGLTCSFSRKIWGVGFSDFDLGCRAQGLAFTRF